MYTARRRALSLADTFTPDSTKYRTMSRRPLTAAEQRALSLADTFAPDSTKYLTMSREPLDAALRRASSSLADTFAPC